MALLSVIRRGHFREHVSIREIGRRTGLSWNTVRKYLRLGSVEPRFKVPERPSKLDPFADRLAAWLSTEAKKNRKQKRTMKQLHRYAACSLQHFGGCARERLRYHTATPLRGTPS